MLKMFNSVAKSFNIEAAKDLPCKLYMGIQSA